MQKYLYILSIMLLSVAQVNGQGWERIYGGSGQDVARSIAATPDGGYIMAGYYNGNSRIFLIKTDVDGKQQWSKQIMAAGPISRSEAFAVVSTRDTGYAIAGYVDIDDNGPARRDIFLLKTDAYGNKLWSKTFGNNLDDEARAMVELPDGSLVLTGFQRFADNPDKENIFVLKTDASGNTLWFNSNIYGAQEYRRRGHSIVAIPNGDLVVVGESETTIGDDKDVLAIRVNSIGSLLWSNSYAINGSANNSDEETRAAIALANGDLLVAGGTNAEPDGAGFLLKIDGAGNPTPIWQKLYDFYSFYGLAGSGNHLFISGYRSSALNLDDLMLLKTDIQGEIVCQAVVGRGGLDIGFDLIPIKGGAVIAGSTEQFVGGFGESYAYLVKTDANCTVLTSYIQANIFRDFNNNCQKDQGEPGLRNWVVRVESPFDTLFTVANANGDLKVEVDTGNFKMVLFPPNPYWKGCDSIVDIQVSSFYDTVFVDIPVRTLFDCPRNEVDITTPILRRCADNTYSIRYCNSGSIPSLNTQVQVALDPNMTLTGSSITAFPLGDNIYQFNLGTLNNGDCGNFTVTAFLSCDTEAGQAHCVTAEISPNDFCNINTGWDGAIIAAKAFCENDSVKLLLENIGPGAMGGPLGYIITEDVVMLTPPGSPDYKFELDAGQSQVVWATVANGSTYRIIAEQSPGYPGAGYPTAAVEGCISDTSTSEVSLGFYTMFPENDADVFIESDCQESNETDFNPLYSKRGHPKGYDVPHYVSPQTDLDFVIQFQNTGADTVQQVVIRDTLSAVLDPVTVFPGAASHPYQFDILGNGIVEFKLTNLNLQPGGGALSEGFVKFRVSQKPNVPCETTIFNSAAIYFDFNAPVFTNTTYHTVCDSFIVLVDTKEVYVKGADLTVYPNPATESVNFKVEGVNAKEYTILLYDIQSRLLTYRSFNQSEFRLLRQDLPAGQTLIYQLAADGRMVASGKLIVK